MDDKYGPNTAEVEALIEEMRSLTPEQITRLDAALDAAWGEAWDAARDALVALVVRDLITQEDFDSLYRPWASVMEAAD